MHKSHMWIYLEQTNNEDPGEKSKKRKKTKKRCVDRIEEEERE